MSLRWTEKGASDLARLHEFLALVSPQAAAKTVRSITVAAGRLLAHPRIGERLESYAPREVRRMIIGAYELRYEISGDNIIVLRIWHTREAR